MYVWAQECTHSSATLHPAKAANKLRCNAVKFTNCGRCLTLLPVCMPACCLDFGHTCCFSATLHTTAFSRLTAWDAMYCF